MTNALYQRFRVGELTATETRTSLADFLGIPMSVLQTEDVAARAIELAMAFGLPTPYDAFYLALAEQLDCELWTADERFYRSVQPAHPRVRVLSEWPG